MFYQCIGMACVVSRFEPVGLQHMGIYAWKVGRGQTFALGRIKETDVKDMG